MFETEQEVLHWYESQPRSVTKSFAVNCSKEATSPTNVTNQRHATRPGCNVQSRNILQLHRLLRP